MTVSACYLSFSCRPTFDGQLFDLFFKFKHVSYFPTIMSIHFSLLTLTNSLGSAFIDQSNHKIDRLKLKLNSKLTTILVDKLECASTQIIIIFVESKKLT